MASWATSSRPDAYPAKSKRVAIDVDLAFVHVRYLDWGGQVTAGVDIFRFDETGKVVEHWDDAAARTSVLEQRQHDVLGILSLLDFSGES